MMQKRLFFPGVLFILVFFVCVLQSVKAKEYAKKTLSFEKILLEYYFFPKCPACKKMSAYLKDFQMEGVAIKAYAVGVSESAASRYAQTMDFHFPVKAVPRDYALFVMAYPTIVLKNSVNNSVDFIEGVIKPEKLKNRVVLLRQKS